MRARKEESRMFGAAEEYIREIKEYQESEMLLGVTPPPIPKRPKPKCCQYCNASVKEGKCTGCGGPNA